MCVLCVAAASLGLLLPQPPGQFQERIQSFPQGIDAISVQFTKKTDVAAVSYKGEGGWSAWEALGVDDEQDPSLTESNLVTFPRGITEIKIRSAHGNEVLHPIRVSQAAVRYEVASLLAMGTPKILTRREWGADDSLLVSKPGSSSSSSSSSVSSEPVDAKVGDESPRVDECEAAYKNYPEEFRASTPIRTNDKGEKLRWPLQYSPSVRLLVVHHTAGAVGDDKRSGAERMRAIYQYHAQSRGWGDVGYHYVIDEDGQIYEGRQGGDFVVAGHAYCNNIGTLGVALMGNFDIENPTQVQIQSLQWLLRTLADKYKIDVSQSVRYHGKELPAIIGHRNVVSTSCPGKQAYAVLDQIRGHVRTGDTAATVAFPAINASSSSSRRSASRSASSASAGPEPVTVTRTGLRPLGTTTIEARPGGEVLLTLLYAPEGPKKRGTKIATVKRSNPRMQLYVEENGAYAPLRASLMAPQSLSDDDSLPIRIKVKIPTERMDSYTLYVGDVSYTIAVSGKRVRSATAVPTRQSYFPDSIPKPLTSTPAPRVVVPATSRSSAASRSSSRPTISTSTTTAASNPLIRIRLNDKSLGDGIATMEAGQATLNGDLVSGAVAFDRDGTRCRASNAGKIVLTADAIRFDPGDSIARISTFPASRQRFRGVLECRVIDGALVLINELPLENYLDGLAEEPDTEPFEKQRAFAVAARTYAAYYIDPAHRKFGTKPYDGSDSPAEFQMYGGYDFEQKNTDWVRATQSTRGQVLKVDGQVVRAPYFSADDGRTRAPDEVGWKNFPHAQVFTSKQDPWCKGETLRGHGVGMSGCGAEGQANEGKSAEQILTYYYPGTTLEPL